MRLATWLLALLLLAAVACGKSGVAPAPADDSVEAICDSDAQAVASPTAVATRTPAVSSTPRPPTATIVANDAFEPVLEAVTLIKQLYVYPLDRFDRDDMLLASWRGAVAYLEGRGVAASTVKAPEVNARLSLTDQNGRFRTAYTSLTSLAAPAGIESRAIADAGIVAATAWLHDEHTRYLPAKRWDLDTRGKRLAFGFRTSPIESGMLVEDVTPGSPAERAGLKPGDVIASRRSPGPDMEGETEFTVLRHEGTVVLKIKQAEEERGQIRTDLVNGRIGIIRLSEFVSSSCDRMKTFAMRLNAEIRSLSERGAKAWVVDLRGNPGGSVRMAAYVAGRFGLLDQLATLRNARGIRTPVEMFADNAIGKAPLAVVVDESSASSSEVFAGALQQAGRAKIVGTDTAGAVVGARRASLKSGGGLYVTVVLIEVGPEGKLINNFGVKPDIDAEMDPALLANEGRDTQLEAAIDYVESQLR